MTIKLFNSLHKKKEIFYPIDPDNVTMYVCGPTVYDRPHLGNARSVVVYDMLFRLLKKSFHKVTFARNITDVDDKINAKASELKIPIQELTKEITGYFHDDISALKVLSPTVEPKATEHIKEMIVMISNLIAANHAYVSEDHVLFDVKSYKNYGELSNRSIDEMISGSRIEVAKYKKDPLDFVLWKPMDQDDEPSSVFESPWGKGRPGWHIECSAMSSKYLGINFDIHGGGADLQFPHHENEIAQSKCANNGSNYAKYWVHNGFLTVGGEKMSKSLKNFITVKDLLDKKIPGIVIRYLLLATHYRKPLDFNDKSLFDAEKSIEKFYSAIESEKNNNLPALKSNEFLSKIIEALSDDLNTPLAFSILHEIVKEIKNSDSDNKPKAISDMIECLNFLGIYDDKYFTKKSENIAKEAGSEVVDVDEDYILKQIELRKKAKSERNWQEADQIRANLLIKNIIIEDKSNGEVIWSFKK